MRHCEKGPPDDDDTQRHANNPRGGSLALGRAVRAVRRHVDDRARRDRRERRAPSIQEDLHFSPSSLAWVVNAYLIAFGGLLLLAGRFGDLFGRARMFLLGVALFTSASLLCGLAWTQTLLVLARFVQGIGGAMTSAVILGMIVTMFPKPREQAKALGIYAFVASAGGSVWRFCRRRARAVRPRPRLVLCGIVLALTVVPRGVGAKAAHHPEAEHAQAQVERTAGEPAYSESL